MIKRIFFIAALLTLTGIALVASPNTKVLAAGETTVKLDTSINPNARVISSPIGIDCPDDCTEAFAPGTAVTLTAAPAEGFGIYKWTANGAGLDSCSESTDKTEKCSFTVPSDGAATVKAAWRYNRVQLKTTTIGSGSGTVTGGFMIICGSQGTLQCNYEYPVGPTDSVLTFTAKPDAGSVFAGWDTTGTVCYDASGSKPAVNTSATCTFTLSPIKKVSTLVGRFEPAPPEAETPKTASGPKLTSFLVDGEAVSFKKAIKIPADQAFTIAGTAAPNAKVNLYIYSEPKKYTVTADEQGEWEYEVKGLPAGSHRIEAATVDPANNKETERVKLLSFTVTASTKKVATTSVADKKEAGFPWIWVVVVVLLVGATVGFIWYMRRKKAKNTPPPATMGPPIGQQPTDDNSTVPPDNTQSQNL